MKRITSLMMCLIIMMTSMCIFASAEGNGTYEFEVDGEEYTVEFVSSDLSAEKQETVAARLVGLEVSEPVPANILCNLFGHDYEYSTTYVTHHKVATIAPRCQRKYYDITTCSRCDYYSETYTRAALIYCCAEE